MLYLFGYGSLVWKHPFPHEWARVGTLHGWRREFCQSSTDHRGVEDAPGRVVTLVRDASATTVGLVFAVAETDRETVLAQLDFRERGGYERLEVDVAMGDEDGAETIRALLYVGTAENDNWVGLEEDEETRAQVIHTAVGPSGANREYFERLMDWLEAVGGGVDVHLRGLQARVARLALLVILMLGCCSAAQEPVDTFPPHARALARMADAWGVPVAADIEPCAWDGITCSPRGHVIALDWSNRGLSGPLGNDIWSIVHLVDIDLHGNELTGTIEPEIARMQNLIVLNLADNRLAGHLPDELEGPPMLEILRLDKNAFRNVPVPMPALRELAMRDNRIAAPLDDSILLFPVLQRLFLSNNDIPGRFPGDMRRRLALLTHVDMRGNERFQDEAHMEL